MPNNVKNQPPAKKDRGPEKPPTQTPESPSKPPVKPTPPPPPPQDPKALKAAPGETAGILPHHKIGLVEILMILLLAAVVFIFIFGMRQMRAEKEQELLQRQKFENVLPTFKVIADSAKAYQARDPFAAWPLTIDEMNLPPNINTPEFKFSFMENGVVTATTTKEFGKEGIKVNYDIQQAAYNIDDPKPDTKPFIKQEWLGE